MVTFGRFFCGTSGWNYRHWKGVFYPEKLPQSRWLASYAERFDTVEINNSFYRLPERPTFENWRGETPPGFTFAVKASRFLTHLRKLREPEEPLERLLDHSSGLGEKLGPILYQLPPHWNIDIERLEHLLALLPKNLRHVFEFRDESWQVASVFDLLRQYGAGYCIMSAPDLPCNIISTADFSYIRMHSGGHDAGSNYADDSLAWWAGQIRPLLDTGDVYVYFNNDYMGYAPKNALLLMEMLGRSPKCG